MLGRFNALDRAMNEFYYMTGKLDARMDSLEETVELARTAQPQSAWFIKDDAVVTRRAVGLLSTLLRSEEVLDHSVNIPIFGNQGVC